MGGFQSIDVEIEEYDAILCLLAIQTYFSNTSNFNVCKYYGKKIFFNTFDLEKYWHVTLLFVSTHRVFTCRV